VHEADLLFGWGRRWRHQFADGVDDVRDGLIMRGKLLCYALLQFVEPPCQFLVQGGQFAQLDEGTHDVYAHFDGTLGIEDGRRHDGAVLGEGKWRFAPAAPT
jgi:hypothetical protein